MNNQPELGLALQDFRNSDDYVDMVFEGLLYHASDWLKYSQYDESLYEQFMAHVKAGQFKLN